MNQVSQDRPATAADVHRLADVAQERGLEVIQDTQGRYFVTSHSDRFALNAVTGFSCDCRGFVNHGRSTNHRLLLQRLGWLLEVEEWGVSGPIGCKPCPVCGGSGRRRIIPAPILATPVEDPWQPNAA